MKLPAAERATHGACSQGFIVVAVLWILGALAILVSIHAVYTIDTAAAFGGYDDRLRAEALVSASIELTAYQLVAKADSSSSRGRFSFRMSQAEVTVDFHSEAARIDLNVAPKELLAGLFSVLGADADDAANYANRVIGWRTLPLKDQDPEVLAYRAAGRTYVSRGAPFAHVEELSLVLDLPPTLVRRVLPFITIYNGHPQVNILEAAPEVLGALPGMTRERLNAVLAQRRTVPENGQALLPLLGPAQAYVTLDDSKASRITVRIAFDNGRQMSSEVIILVLQDGAEPYSILSWRDLTE